MRILQIIYDNGAYNSIFPMGLSAIASVMLKEGHEVDVLCQDIHHLTPQQIKEYLDENEPYDMTQLSLIGGYYQYQQLKNISWAVNSSKNRPTYYVLGGHGPSPDPKFFLDVSQADIVALGEGEETIVRLLRALSNGDFLSTVTGIAYKNGEDVIINPRTPLVKDIDSLPWPAYHLYPIDVYRLVRVPNIETTEFCMPMISGRGCTFTCNFCYRLDEGFRGRDPKAMLEEIEFLQKTYNIGYFAFYDELLMTSVKRTTEVCEAFLSSGLRFHWDCNGRLGCAKPEVLKLMKKSGCVFINYGIESVDDHVLKNMRKGQTFDVIESGIRATLEAGISPGYNTTFGHIGDTAETLEKCVQFLLKYDDGSQKRTIKPITPYPGTPLYYDAIKMGKLDKENPCRDFYERAHVNSDLVAVNFTEYSDEEFHRLLYDANRRLLENYYENKKIEDIKVAKRLYLERDVTFRGFRHRRSGGSGYQDADLASTSVVK